ncbi:hypothetical protein B484DRAFT_447022 [Ochromonadaceae sp. CCMP2298]|nr:hypothetical protein B484DRAFT_447022 [Ochromonadaceae sp. CCMP2298]|mmetsp:Transcript_1344/g.3113  ORF Transcript_1344/g.3113 Transcript_1344/m.3113 type:complete len:279 (+) Transcript_1344:146-982(+)
MSFFSTWYNEGMMASPPPCLLDKYLYLCMSENFCCNVVGRIGLSWGDKNRGPIMFVSFWISFVSLVLISVSMASLSYTGSVVRDVAFFQGTIKLNESGYDSSVNFYAGLNAVNIQSCDDANCPDTTQTWGEASCPDFFVGCDECVAAARGSVSTLIMAFITQIPQLSTDIQRSTVGGDLHCQKTFGIITGIFGTLTTLSALSSFAGSCYRDFDSATDGDTLDKKLGPAFYLLLVATLLKILDVIAHIIVPVPKAGYWRPASSKVEGTKGTKDTELTEP